MKKKLLGLFVPILFQSFLVQCSEAEFYQAIKPSLQSAQAILKNPMISVELDSILNGLLGSVQSGAISKEAAVDKMNAIKNALHEFTKRQYTNWWSYRFGSTPEIVKNKVQPAIHKVNHAISVVNENALSQYAIAGIAVGAVAAAAAAGAAGGYGIYKWREAVDKRKKQVQKKANIADKKAYNAKISRIAGSASTKAFAHVCKLYVIKDKSSEYYKLYAQYIPATTAAQNALIAANGQADQELHDIALHAAEEVYRQYAQDYFDLPISKPSAEVAAQAAQSEAGGDNESLPVFQGRFTTDEFPKYPRRAVTA